jgi:hypothetical protein
MTPAKMARVARLLNLKKKKTENELARIGTGVAAGRALREKLEQSESDVKFRDFSIGYLTRTVGIIDRGLVVLQEQSKKATADLMRLENNMAVLKSKTDEWVEAATADEAEEQLMETISHTSLRTSKQA